MESMESIWNHPGTVKYCSVRSSIHEGDGLLSMAFEMAALYPPYIRVVLHASDGIFVSFDVVVIGFLKVLSRPICQGLGSPDVVREGSVFDSFEGCGTMTSWRGCVDGVPESYGGVRK